MTSQETTVLTFAVAVVLLPFISALASMIIPQRYSWLAPIAATALMLAATVCAIVLFLNKPVAPMVVHIPWFAFGNSNASFSVLLDQWAILVVTMVTTISFLVHLFSIGYMASENELPRYFSWLGLFTFAMIGLVMTGNLLVLFGCWEIVGLASYFLIGFWRTKEPAVLAASKAFLMNKAGDVCFLAGLLILWATGGTLNIDKMEVALQATPHAGIAGILILCGVVSKSAQFPLLSWLPAAMEGPTPVSALIHAATMVAAGIFLIARIDFVFDQAAILGDWTLMSIVGGATAGLGAIAALTEFNIKKILAWSTVSQLGFMIMVMGTGNTFGAQAHLITHAFFKAGLFLCAGAMSHVLEQACVQSNVRADVQDVRNLGGLASKMKFTFACFAICAASLMGLPFTSGFLSKDAMIISTLTTTVFFAELVLSFITVMYTFRLVWYAFLRSPEETSLSRLSLPVTPWVMRIPIALLAVGSLWFMVSTHPFAFMNSTLLPEITENNDVLGTALFVASVRMITFTTAGLVLVALLLSFLYYRKRRPSPKPVAMWTSSAFGLDLITDRLLVRTASISARLAEQFETKWIDRSIHLLTYTQVTIAHLITWFDKSVLDGLVRGIGNISKGIGNIARSVANGKIQGYILWALAAMVIFIIRNLFSRP